jgi:hypothetical protein
MLMNATANRPRQQRQVVALIVLLTALAVIVGIQLLPLIEGSSAPPPAPIVARPAATPPSAANGRRPPTPARSPSGHPGHASAQSAAHPTTNGAVAVEDVHLAQLKQPEPEPIEGHRNPFSFAAEPKPASASAAKGGGPGGSGVTPVVPAAPVAAGPPPVPPPPPITLKFFGVVTGPGRIGKVAALGDGKFVYHGQEGSIVEGRYRIVKIGEESIQLEYVDGRGRQTIRLSGK